MRRVTSVDPQGRWTAVWLPDGAPDSDAPMGIPIGPPSLDSLGLPPEVQTRLHNELFVRGIYSVRDAISGRQNLVGALMSALKLDVERITDIYRQAAADKS